MARKAFNKGNLVAEYTINGTRVKVYDGGLIATSPNDPKVQAALKRIARIATEDAMSRTKKAQ